MKIGAVVQARMGNSRFPGKNGVLLCGKPQIWHVLNRLQQCQTFNEIILALPHESNGTVQKEAARELDIPVLDYKGDYNNVLHRHVLAADIMDFDIVVRVPGDNTLVDPRIVDDTVRTYNRNPPRWNYLCSSLDDFGEGHPAGLGCEIWDVRFLQWLDATVTEKRHREHPHKWPVENKQVEPWAAYPWLDYQQNPSIPCKFSVDTPEEWEWTKRIYEALYPIDPNFRTRDVLLYLGEQNEQRNNR